MDIILSKKYINKLVYQRCLDNYEKFRNSYRNYIASTNLYYINFSFIFLYSSNFSKYFLEQI